MDELAAAQSKATKAAIAETCNSPSRYRPSNTPVSHPGGAVVSSTATSLSTPPSISSAVLGSAKPDPASQGYYTLAGQAGRVPQQNVLHSQAIGQSTASIAGAQPLLCQPGSSQLPPASQHQQFPANQLPPSQQQPLLQPPAHAGPVAQQPPVNDSFSDVQIFPDQPASLPSCQYTQGQVYHPPAASSAQEVFYTTLTQKLGELMSSSSKKVVSRDDFPVIFEHCYGSGVSYDTYLRNPEHLEAKERAFKQTGYESKEELLKRYLDLNKPKVTVLTTHEAHDDDCSSVLHPVRFLRGPLRSPGDVFVEATKVIPSLDPSPVQPVSAYEISELGIGFTIPPAVWKKLHCFTTDNFSIIDILSIRNFGSKKLSHSEVSVDLFQWGLSIFCSLSSSIFPWDRSTDILMMWVSTKRIQANEKYWTSPIPTTGESFALLFDAWFKERGNRYAARLPCPSSSDITSLFNDLAGANPRLHRSGAATDRPSSDVSRSNGRSNFKAAKAPSKKFPYPGGVWKRFVDLCSAHKCCATFNAAIRECDRPKSANGKGCTTQSGDLAHLCPRCQKHHKFAISHKSEMV